MTLRDGDTRYFYELHESDDDVYTDVLLAHHLEYDEAEFLELVLEARSAVLATFEEDTLSEAVARRLAAEHGFLVVDDSQLRVAVEISADEGETRVVSVDERSVVRDEADDDFRSLVLDVEVEDRLWRDR